jgi:hypothetical protein
MQKQEQGFATKDNDYHYDDHGYDRDVFPPFQKKILDGCAIYFFFCIQERRGAS